MRVVTDFPGGNALDAVIEAPDRLRFAADRHDGPCAMWFHFRVLRPACETLHCALVNGDELFGWPYSEVVRPVYRGPGSPWQRCAQPIVDADAGTFSFAVPCQREDVEIAFCHPYQPADWDHFVRTSLAGTGARVRSVGVSLEGHELQVCELGNGPATALLTARAHAGETPGSFVLEGLLTALAALPGLGCRVLAIPFLDLDGVIAGRYGKLRPPRDHYLAWGPEPVWPEIAIYEQVLDDLAPWPLIAIDCHAPLAHHPHFVDSTGMATATGRLRSRLDAVVRDLQATCRTPGTTLSAAMNGPHPGWLGDNFAGSLPGWLQQRYGTIALTFEAAYHATHEGVVVGPDDWRALGRSAALSVARAVADQPRRSRL